jgi:hypothetical protein
MITAQFKARVGSQEITFYPGQKVKLDDPIANKLILEGKAKKLIENEDRSICYKMTEESLKRINENYKGGALEWIKRTRPVIWKRLTDLESIINSCVFRNDQAGLTKALKEYERLVVDTVYSWRGGAAPLFKIKS